MMRRMANRLPAVVSSVLVAAVAVLSAQPAHAYLDSGTGSMLLQMIVATVTGGLFLVKVYWRRIKAAITGRPIDEDNVVMDDPKNGND
jgi:hypothetical protein